MLISSFDSKRNSLNLRLDDSFVFFQATLGAKVWLGGSFYSKLASLKEGVFCGGTPRSAYLLVLVATEKENYRPSGPTWFL